MNMISSITWLVGGVLLVLSGIHVYWMLGGRRGSEAAIPITGSDPLFRPSKLVTGVVVILLALAAWIVLALGGVIGVLLPGWIINYGGWLLVVVFIVRAIGDFKWLGFFKRERGTVFAKWDSMLHSPLCLLIGVGILVIVLNG